MGAAYLVYPFYANVGGMYAANVASGDNFVAVVCDGLKSGDR